MSEKSNLETPEGVLTKAKAQEICPRFNFVYKLQCFQRCLRRKKNVQGFLVVHLLEISKEFLIFIDLKITETRFTVPFRARSLLLNINILFAVSVTHVDVNTLNYALIFYPFMNTVKPQVEEPRFFPVRLNRFLYKWCLT